MTLSKVDRDLLHLCLDRAPRSWDDFVDRYLGLVVHVVRHTAQARAFHLSAEDTEDLVSEVFVGFFRDDFALLRRFRGNSSLATYLTVVARRIVARQMAHRKSPANLGDSTRRIPDNGTSPEDRLTNREEVAKLLSGLNGPEAEVVRLFHLEGKSYQEISSRVGIPENSVGPTLSRARKKMRGQGFAAT